MLCYIGPFGKMLCYVIFWLMISVMEAHQSCKRAPSPLINCGPTRQLIRAFSHYKKKKNQKTSQSRLVRGDRRPAGSPPQSGVATRLPHSGGMAWPVPSRSPASRHSQGTLSKPPKPSGYLCAVGYSYSPSPEPPSPCRGWPPCNQQGLWAWLEETRTVRSFYANLGQVWLDYFDVTGVVWNLLFRTTRQD